MIRCCSIGKIVAVIVDFRCTSWILTSFVEKWKTSHADKIHHKMKPFLNFSVVYFNLILSLLKINRHMELFLQQTTFCQLCFVHLDNAEFRFQQKPLDSAIGLGARVLLEANGNITRK